VINKRSTSSTVPPRIGSLRVNGLTKVFDAPDGGAGHIVLDQIDLEVQPQESVGIIGPNGAGKSTLLKLIAGVTPPTAGSIQRVGRTCSVIELGAAVHPDLTGRENAELLAALYGIPPRRLPHLLDQIIGFAELEHAIDWLTRQYSTGMVARLAFAVAAYSDPDLLLLDEVLSVGDLPFQLRCRQRVEELRGEGTTVLMVSHDMELVAAVCDRVLLLQGARVAHDGPSTKVINRYLGLPDSQDGDRRLTLECKRSRLPAGEPIEVTISSLTASEAVQIDLVVANHPTLAAHGIDQSVIFGTTEVAVGRSSEVELSSRHLPPGRYELHASLPSGAVAIPVPVVLTGPRPEPFATQLDSSWSKRPISEER
jgi:ABC-2 type transport system ATP-binding protein